MKSLHERDGAIAPPLECLVFENIYTKISENAISVKYLLSEQVVCFGTLFLRIASADLEGRL